MAISNKLCLHCDLCECPEINATAIVAYCSKPASDSDDRSVYTIISAQFQMKVEDESTSREVCHYQARVRVLGSPNNASPSAELELLTSESEQVPSECDSEKYSFVHDFKFEYENNILDQARQFLKTLYVEGCYADIEMEVDIYALAPENEEETEFGCEDYAIMETSCSDKDGDSSTSSILGDTVEVCTCSWSSLDHDPTKLVKGFGPIGDWISYDEIEGGVCDVCDPCRIAPCFACGHLPISSAPVHYLKSTSSLGSIFVGSLDMTMATTLDVKSDYEYDDAPLLADVKAECFVMEGGEERIIFEHDFTFAYAGKFDSIELRTPKWWDTIPHTEVNTAGIVDYNKYKDTEIYIRYIPQESCECECLYGRKCSTSDNPPTLEYVGGNPLNTDLFRTQTNYLNTEFAVGNCKSTPTQPESSGQSTGQYADLDETELTYWCRLSSVIKNHVADKYGHNCEYSVTAKWFLLEDEVWSRQFNNNDLVDDDIFNPEIYKTADLSSTELLPELTESQREYLNTASRDPFFYMQYDQSYIEICVDEASSSTADGHTQVPKTFSYDACDGCCQKYPITNYCSEEAGPCMVCDKEKYLQNEKFQLSINKQTSNELLYTALVVDTCLVYVAVDVPDSEQSASSDQTTGWIAHGHGELPRIYSTRWNIDRDADGADKLNVVYGPVAEEVLQHTTPETPAD